MKVIESRKKYYALSIGVILIGLLFMIINQVSGKGAFNQDVEFTGGYLIETDIKKPFTNEIKDEIQKIAEDKTKQKNVRVISSGTTGVVISMPHTEAKLREDLITALMEKYQITNKDIKQDNFSPTISQDIKTGAVQAVVVGTILILIYITIRFKDYKFGMSAVLALIHDVLVMLTVYAIFRVPLNNSFIAAMLTIVGYSINDTIVVFDRIRENKVKKGIKQNQAASVDLVDGSINQTIGRSVSTSITTIVMVFLLFILGTESVKEFAFPLMIGVAAGTYSSIFIASPVWYDLTHRHAKAEKNKKEKNKKETISK